MKRYLVFSGSQYYPSGGWEDFINDYDNLQEAETKAKSEAGVCQWAQVVDTLTKTMVVDL